MHGTTSNIRARLVPALAIAGWGLTIALVYQLLSGTFADGRSCQTACVQTIYWSAFVTTVAGLAAAIATRDKSAPLFNTPSSAALAVLLAIFAATMFIGTFL